MKQCYPHPPQILQPQCCSSLLSSFSSSCPMTSQPTREHITAFEEVSMLFNKDDTSTVTKRNLELGSAGQNATEAK